MQLSIIIPFYNAHKRDIARCLDSIYNSIPDRITLSDFEVICVNDASTLPDGVKAVEDYLHLVVHPSNLNVLTLSTQKRAGGARNVGVSHASGDYIQFLDSDDALTDRALLNIFEAIDNHNGLDLIMFDNLLANENGTITEREYYLHHNHSRAVTGGEFLRTQEVPWRPWSYLYRREFLMDHNLHFVEGIRYEDVDFVLKATLLAKKMIFIPKANVIYTVSSINTSTIGDSEDKIIEMHQLSYRLGLLAEDALSRNLEGGDEIAKHYIFHVKIHLKKYMWRLPYRRILEMLISYPLTQGVKLPPVLAAMRRHPRAMAVAIAAVSPVLHFIYNVYRYLK